MANTGVSAADNAAANASAEAVAAWVAGYCGTYSYAVLVAAGLFLLGGLIAVGFAAYHEGRKSLAEAERVEAEARKAEAEAKKAQAGVPEGVVQDFQIPIKTVTTFVKSFATVLGDAKAWVAMVIIGLLLLWMAGNAPSLCKSGFKLTADGNTAEQSDGGDNAGGNEAENGADEGAGNSGDNASGNASENASGNAADGT